MNPRDAALAALRDLAERDLDLPAPAAQTLADWLDSWIAPSPPVELVARPCPAPAARWHLDALRTLEQTPAGRARRAYHARMLGYLLAPERADLRPSVTVLIPVYNRAAKVVEAVESCLAQDWWPLEILVVDDGSTDDPAAALRRFGDAVRVLRRANGGVSSARNAGIAAARGDLIHFLDSDNLLLPEAVSAKVAAFATIADAGLCGSAAKTQGYAPGTSTIVRAPSGAADCPTEDLLRAAVRRCPFFISTLMIARWVALAVGPFEEDLRYHEDARYWLTLGLRGTKAIGLRSQLTIRRNSPDGLSDNREPHDPVGIVVRLRGMRDLLQASSAWVHAAPLFTRSLRSADWSGAASKDPRVRAAMDELLVILDDLIRRRQSGGLSLLPLAAGMRHALWRAIEDGLPVDAKDPLLGAMTARLVQMAQAATPLSEHDIAFWRRSASSADVAHRLQVWAGFASDHRDDPRALHTLDWFMRRSWRIPRKRGLRRLLAWQRHVPWLGRRLALARFGARHLTVR